MSETKSYEAIYKHGRKQPDEFKSSIGVQPKASFIVAYDRDGNPVSRYGDDVWDMSAYQRNTPTRKLDFVTWSGKEQTEEQAVISKEIKWILFVYWYFSDSTKAVNTLAGTLSYLRTLARYCSEHQTTPIKLLNNPVGFASYLNTLKTAMQDAYCLVCILINIGEIKRGFPLLLDVNLNTLAELARAENRQIKQHPVIPTRIYSELITNAIEEITKFESVADTFLKLLKDCASNPNLGRSRRSQSKQVRHRNSTKTYLSTLPELLGDYDLNDYVKEYFERNNKEIKYLRNMVFILHEIQSICFLLITIFSGMRRGEIARLPYNCLETHYEYGKKHYFLCGETFKQADGIAKQTKWLTDPTVERVIFMLQKISDLIYSTLGETLNHEKKNSSDYPLFIGTGYLPFLNKKRKSRPKNAPYAHSAQLSTKDKLPKSLVPTIIDADILELESIDPFRSWRSEERFTIGLNWPYTPHQARRSLAVYASASGIVSLPSLKRQLQHVTEEMTIYYAKGSAFAKKLVAGNKDHFYHDYQAAHPEAQALAYIAQVLMSDELLFGGHGAWITQQRNYQNTLSYEDRETVMKRFRRGEISYLESPIGGCTSVEPCDKRAMRTVSACLVCAKAVIKESKLNRVIKITNAHVQRLDPSSVEIKLKINDLAELKKYGKRIKSRTNSK